MSSESSNSFLRNVATLLSGNVIAQLVALIGMTWLQRNYYSPTQFASFPIFFELCALFASVGALRLETGLVLVESDEKARNLFMLCFKILFGITILGGLIGYLGGDIHPSLEMVANSTMLAILFPIAIFFTGGVQILNAWHTRESHFKLMASSKVTQSIISIGSQFSLAFTAFKGTGLISGKIIGSILNFSVLIKRYFKNSPSEKDTTSNKQLIAENKDYILYTSPSVFVASLTRYAFYALFLQYFGEDIIGKLGATKHYLGVGIALVSTAFAQAYFKELSGIQSKEALKRSYTYWLKRLTILSIIGVGIIHVIPDSMVVSILGDKWDGLMETIRIMSIWMGVMFVSSSLSYIYIKTGKQKVMFGLDILHLLLVVGSILIAVHQNQDAITTLWWFTFAQIFHYILAIFAAFRFINTFNSAK